MKDLNEILNTLINEYESKANLPSWFVANLKTKLSKNITIEDWNTIQLYLANVCSDNVSLYDFCQKLISNLEEYVAQVDAYTNKVDEYTNQVEKKLDKRTEETLQNQVYAKSSTGIQYMENVNNLNMANSIVKRDANNNFYTGTPTNDNHATSKRYVDQNIKNLDNTKLTKVTTTHTNARLYGVSTIGNQEMKSYTSDLLAYSIVMRNINNTFAIGTPVDNNNPTTKQYVDNKTQELNNSKLDKLNNLTYGLYAYSNGKNKLLKFDVAASADSIVFRDNSGGVIVNPNPTKDNHATPKSYVDKAVQNVMEVAEGKTRTITIDLNNHEGYYNHLFASNNNYVEIYKGVKIITTDNKEVLLSDLKVGDIILIDDLDYPDRWLSNTGNPSGSYYFSLLETRKIDLSNYTTKDFVAENYVDISTYSSDIGGINGYIASVEDQVEEVNTNLGQEINGISNSLNLLANSMATKGALDSLSNNLETLELSSINLNSTETQFITDEELNAIVSKLNSKVNFLVMIPAISSNGNVVKFTFHIENIAIAPITPTGYGTLNLHNKLYYITIMINGNPSVSTNKKVIIKQIASEPIDHISSISSAPVQSKTIYTELKKKLDKLDNIENGVYAHTTEGDALIQFDTNVTRDTFAKRTPSGALLAETNPTNDKSLVNINYLHTNVIRKINNSYNFKTINPFNTTDLYLRLVCEQNTLKSLIQAFASSSTSTNLTNRDNITSNFVRSPSYIQIKVLNVTREKLYRISLDVSSNINLPISIATVENATTLTIYQYMSNYTNLGVSIGNAPYKLHIETDGDITLLNEYIEEDILC